MTDTTDTADTPHHELRRIGAMLTLVTLVMLCMSPMSLSATQRIDPDWCWTCKDSREHFVSGVGVGIAARILLPKAHTWQRIAISAAIGAAYELGQMDVSMNGGPQGPGFGFGPKDLILDVAGTVLVEFVWSRLDG